MAKEQVVEDLDTESDAEVTTFTVILEKEPELAGKLGYVYDYNQWTESIEAIDIEEAWKAARARYYMPGYVDPARNSRVQIVDIKSGVVEVEPRVVAGSEGVEEEVAEGKGKVKVKEES